MHQLRYANASGNELQAQLEISGRMGILTTEEAATLIADAEEVGRMLHELVDALERGTRS